MIWVLAIRAARFGPALLPRAIVCVLLSTLDGASARRHSRGSENSSFLGVRRTRHVLISCHYDTSMYGNKKRARERERERESERKREKARERERE